MALGHDIIRHHSPRFADVELTRPATRGGELVLGRSPSFHLVPNVLRDARAGREKDQETARVTLMLLERSFAGGIIRFGKRVVGADVIGRKGSVVVDVGLL